MTMGSLVGTLPAGALAQRFGLRPLLIVLFVTAPLVNAMRAVWVWEPAQIGLAFLAGLAMSSWGIYILPGVARLTGEKNRTAGLSLIFSASVGTSLLGGIVCGYLRQWLEMAGFAMQPAEVKRLILLVSCAIAFLGLIPVLRLRIPSQSKEEAAPDVQAGRWNWLRAWKLNPFLWRFLPLMALWSAVLAAFTPFANVYLSRQLHVQMTQIGLIFSTVQVLQLCMGNSDPICSAHAWPGKRYRRYADPGCRGARRDGRSKEWTVGSGALSNLLRSAVDELSRTLQPADE